MSVVTLKDELVVEVTSNGTWSYVGTTNPYPAAPGTWDGTVDFTGFATGLPYIYRYTVPSTCVGDPDLTADVTINLNEYANLVNDDCAGALPSLLTQGNTEQASRPNQNMVGECPGSAPATDSGEAIPGNWPTVTYVGDMWYLVNIEVITGPVFFEIVVESSPYPVGEKQLNSGLALYTGTCGALVLDSSIGPTSEELTYLGNFLATGSYEYYVRVGSPDGEAGKFTITFQITT